MPTFEAPKSARSNLIGVGLLRGPHKVGWVHSAVKRYWIVDDECFEVDYK